MFITISKTKNSFPVSSFWCRVYLYSGLMIDGLRYVEQLNTVSAVLADGNAVIELR